MRTWGGAALAATSLLLAGALVAIAGPVRSGSSGPTPPAEAQASSASPHGTIPVEAPEAAASPIPTSSPVPSSSLVSGVPAQAAPRDRVDRAWPAHPPWDACPRPVWPGKVATGAPGSGRRILLIGDSLTRDSRSRTATLLRRSGWTPTFRCWGSKRLNWGIAQVARARRLGQLPGWVVIALGTNDISWETEATTRSRIHRLLRVLGPERRVLWVDLHLTRSAWLDARAARFNDYLDTLQRRHRNLTVVHWHRRARQAGIRGWDGIHYGPQGFALRARFLADAIDSAVVLESVPHDDTPNTRIG